MKIPYLLLLTSVRGQETINLLIKYTSNNGKFSTSPLSKRSINPFNHNPLSGHKSYVDEIASRAKPISLRDKISQVQVGGGEVESVMEALLGDEEVALVEVDFPMYNFPNVPQTEQAHQQQEALNLSRRINSRELEEIIPPGITQIQAPLLWSALSSLTSSSGELFKRTPTPIKVCIVDTGYDKTHPDLPQEGITSTKTLFESAFSDGDGHGTHVAGIIGAVGNDGGVVGVNPTPNTFTFHISKSLSDDGRGSSSTVLSGVEGCLSTNSKIITLSLGGSKKSTLQQDLFQKAYDEGVLIFAASGNSGTDAQEFPAGYDTVISVAAVGEEGEWADFSNWGGQVELCGPGVGVRSTLPGGGYGISSGTSMAAPHVAGAAALVWSYFPECSNVQIRNVLALTAKDVSPSGFNGCNIKTGFGLVQVKDAYDMLDRFGCEAGGNDSESLSEGVKGGCHPLPEKPETESPTSHPTKNPSQKPTDIPTAKPSDNPSTSPSKSPSTNPSGVPSSSPMKSPSKSPSDSPTFRLFKEPVLKPSSSPTQEQQQRNITGYTSFQTPSYYPSALPIHSASASPSTNPSASPTDEPTKKPSISPSSSPIMSPSVPPSTSPSNAPSKSPIKSPTQSPTTSPSMSPSSPPPSKSPTESPSSSVSPSSSPTESPSASPSRSPSNSPSHSPTASPSNSPTTQSPSKSPQNSPSTMPSTSPSTSPTTMSPSTRPSNLPTNTPFQSPTGIPTTSPSTKAPSTKAPSNKPSNKPTNSASNKPTDAPASKLPTGKPSEAITSKPTVPPSSKPSVQPTDKPTDAPTNKPTNEPTAAPTNKPTIDPTSKPTDAPSTSPFNSPTMSPSVLTPSPSKSTNLAQNKCAPGEAWFNIEFTFDEDPSKVYWFLLDKCSRNIIYSCEDCHKKAESYSSDSFGGCLPEAGYKFYFNDYSGKAWTNGGYVISYDGNEVFDGMGNVKSSQVLNFGSQDECTKPPSLAPTSLAPTSSAPTIQCAAGEVHFEVQFSFDAHPNKIYWFLIDRCENVLKYDCQGCYTDVPSYSTKSFSRCLPDGQYSFIFNDYSGTKWLQGGYTLSYAGSQIFDSAGDVKHSQTLSLGSADNCPVTTKAPQSLAPTTSIPTSLPTSIPTKLPTSSPATLAPINSLTSCSANHLPFDISFKFDADPAKIYWYLIDRCQRSVVYDCQGCYAASNVRSSNSFSRCLPDGHYSFIFNDYSGTEWSQGGYVINYNGLEIFDNMGNVEPSEEVTFGSYAACGYPTDTPTLSPTTRPYCEQFVLDLVMDDKPMDISWTLQQISDDHLGAVTYGPVPGQPYQRYSVYLGAASECLTPGEYKFTINDTRGDGLANPGYYKIFLNDIEIRGGSLFGSQQETGFIVSDRGSQDTALFQ